MNQNEDDHEKDHQSVSVDIATLKLYVNYLEAQERKNKIKINEKFQTLKCYQNNNFGTATSFKFVVGGSFLNRNFNGSICPLNGNRSPILKVERFPQPSTFGMRINVKHEPAFVKFVSSEDNVTVFSPEMPEPIGRIVRRKAEEIINDESDIVCYATNTEFTMKNAMFEADSRHVPSMQIFDSTGNVLATACVTKMITTTRYITTITLHEFAFHIADSIPEPTKLMFLVAFSNWVKWSRNEANGRYPMWVVFLRIAICLFVVFFVAFWSAGLI